ncbi:hypothetical protein BaRGS_00037952, partial [Batillaria attramentaria]
MERVQMMFSALVACLLVVVRISGENVDVLKDVSLRSAVADSDHLINGLNCFAVPGICQDTYGPVICPRFCGGVEPNPTGQYSTTERPTHSHTTSQQFQCRDHVVATLLILEGPQVLIPLRATPVKLLTKPPFQRSHAHHTLPTHNTTPTSQSPTTSKPTTASSPPVSATTASVCEDNTAQGVSCDQLKDVCIADYAHLLCPKYCGCEDHLEPGLTCAGLVGTLHRTKEELCADSVGREACAKFCGCPACSLASHLFTDYNSTTDDVSGEKHTSTDNN